MHRYKYEEHFKTERDILPISGLFKTSNNTRCSSPIKPQKSKNLHKKLNARLLIEPYSTPSIPSSVLYLQRSSNTQNKIDICSYTGGGFKGAIKKKKETKHFLPKIKYEIPVKHKKTKSYAEIIKLLKKSSITMPKNDFKIAFKDKVLGKKIPEAGEINFQQNKG